MSKNVIINFTDECGVYRQIRDDVFLKSHPYYARANFIIEINEYIELENIITEIKNKYSVPYNAEIKWSHLGSRLKNNHKNIPHDLNADKIKEYIVEVLTSVCSQTKSVIYYTFTDNRIVNRINESKLIKWHLQNAFQRSQAEAEKIDGYAIVVADDMNSQNKNLKKALYRLTMEGDRFTDYPNVQKGLFVEYSNMSCGLQIADFLAGVFTASIKYITSSPSEKHKFEYAYNVLTEILYQRIRNNDYNLPNYDVYGFGIKEIPSGVGKDTAIKLSTIIENKLHHELLEEMYRED